MVRTGVLGGTFDPPHLGHLVLAACARRALELDRVLFVPAGIPWRKADREVTPAPLRLRMVEAAVADFEWAEVSTIEVQREGPSYAAETMRALASDGEELWFVLGMDAFADMPNWHEPEALLRLSRLALADRDGESVVSQALARLPGVESRIDLVPMLPLDVSSSELRRRVRDGETTDVLLPATVRAVVDEAGLYRG